MIKIRQSIDFLFYTRYNKEYVGKYKVYKISRLKIDFKKKNWYYTGCFEILNRIKEYQITPEKEKELVLLKIYKKV